MSFILLSVELLLLGQMHHVIIVVLHFSIVLVVQVPNVVLQLIPLISEVVELPLYLLLSLPELALVVLHLLLDLIILQLHDVDLSVKHKLISMHLQLSLVQLLYALVIVTPHLLILLLEKTDVLETAFLIVKQ